jgi:hypothetical protein
MYKNEIRKEIENYKKIVAHLNEHIKEGNFDNLDISQSNLLKKEIKRLQPLIKGGNINLLKAVEIPKDDELYNFSNPKEAQKKAFKYIDKSAILYKSSNPKKKYMIFDPNINKMVHFGQMDFEDATHHNNKKRIDNFKKRNWKWANNPKYTPSFLSYYLLW